MEKIEVLKIIDYEYSLANENKHKNGVTVWVLWSSLAAIVWLSLNLIQNGVNIKTTSQIILFLLLFFDFLNFIISPVINPSNTRPKLIRFFSIYNFNLGSYIFKLLEASSVFWLLVLSKISVAKFFLWSMSFYYLIFSFLSLFIFFMLITNVPLPYDKEFNNKNWLAFYIINSLFYLLFFASLFLNNYLHMKSFDLNDIRLAFLVFTIVLLLRELFKFIFIRDLHLGILVELRRGLNFDYISTDEAYKQIDILIYGRKMNYFTQENIQQFVILAQEINDSSKLLKKKLRNKNVVIESEVFEGKLNEISMKIDNLEKVGYKIINKSKLLFFIYPETIELIKEEREKIRKYLDDVKLNISGLREEFFNHHEVVQAIKEKKS